MTASNELVCIECGGPMFHAPWEEKYYGGQGRISRLRRCPHCREALKFLRYAKSLRNAAKAVMAPA